MSTFTLSEYESKRLLAERGVACAPERLVDDAEGAVRAADALGYPAVVKACGPGLAHKTERGLVALALADADAVRAAATDILGRFGAGDAELRLLVASMVRGRRELIVGALRDATFGATVMVGIGGVFAEAVADVSFRLAPLDAAVALDQLDDLRLQALMGAYRGEPSIDRDAVAAVLVAVGDLIAADPSIVSIDVNPLVLTADGPVAVDALVERELS